MVIRFPSAVAAVALLATPAAAASHALRGVALVIGETDYKSLPALANPDDDARAIDDMLHGLGFEEDRVLDASTADLKSRLDKFLADASGADVALIYYAGHGIEAGGKDYLMGTDADVSDPGAAAATLVPVDDLLARLQKAVPISIVLLDACRTDPFPVGETITLSTQGGPVSISPAGLDAVRGTMPVNGPQSGLGTVVGFSASPGQSALDGPAGSNSPYASALLKHLGAAGYSFGDVMTLVSNEVYVETGARQLPWTSSSLSRVLYFGRSETAPAGDDGKILDDRRKLLLDIAAVPDASRAAVETIASKENLKLADLYAMLDIIDAGKADADSMTSAVELANVAGRVRQTLDDPLLPAAPTDPELARLDALASKAIAAGDFALGYAYRQQELQRTAVIEKGLDTKQADIDAQRRQLAGVYARVAEAAMYTAKPDVEAKAYSDAAKQAASFDPSLSLKLLQRSADSALVEGNHGDILSYPLAIAIYQNMLGRIDKAKAPGLWAATEAKLAWVLDNSSQMEARRNYDAIDAARAALTLLTPRNGFEAWTQASMSLVHSLVLTRQFPEGIAAAKAFVAAYTPSLRANNHLGWADAENEYANALRQAALSTATLDKDAQAMLKDAADAFGAAAAEAKPYSRRTYDMQVEQVGYTLAKLGEATGDIKTMLAGVAKGKQGLLGFPDKDYNLAYLTGEYGEELAIAGVATGDQAMLKQAVEELETAAPTMHQQQANWEWGHARQVEGNALTLLGKRNRDRDALQKAIAVLGESIEGFSSAGDNGNASQSGSLRTEAEEELKKLAAPVS